METPRSKRRGEDTPGARARETPAPTQRGREADAVDAFAVTSGSVDLDETPPPRPRRASPDPPVEGTLLSPRVAASPEDDARRPPDAPPPGDDLGATRISPRERPPPPSDDLGATRISPRERPSADDELGTTRVSLRGEISTDEELTITRGAAPESDAGDDDELDALSTMTRGGGGSGSGGSRPRLRDLLATPSPSAATWSRRAALRSDHGLGSLGDRLGSLSEALIAEIAAGEDGEDDESLPTHINRYLILRRLGRGGMGVVYAAYDEHLDRKIAIKLLRDPDAGEEASERLLREAQALARVSHPNVVTVHEVGVFEGAVYIVMEFITGMTLRTWLAEQDRSIAEILAVFRQAGEGLAAAHAAGLIHRDFKPENAMVGDDGRIRVFDFGLARGVVDGEPAVQAPAKGDDLDRDSLSRLDQEMTVAGTLLGTPAYMAPEQHLAATTDARTDVFAFTVALYEALYGERPFGGETFDELQLAVTLGRVKPPPAGASVPPWLRRVLLRGLAVDPDDRWPSMGALLDALADDPIARRRRWLRWSALLVLLSAVAAALPVAVVELRARMDHEAREARAAERWRQSAAAIAALLDERRPEDADATFNAFAQAPEHRGTIALSEAWLERGRHLYDQGASEAAMAAFASAYTAAPTAALERRTLMAIASLFQERRDFDPLIPLVEALGDDELKDPEAAGLAIDVALYLRDFDRADELIEALGERASENQRSARALIHAIAPATRLGRLDEELAPIDVDGDGRVEIVHLSRNVKPPRQIEIIRLPSGERSTHLLPEGLTWATLVRERPLILATTEKGHHVVLAYGDGVMSERWRGTLTSPHKGPLAADLDRDGLDEIYLATDRPRGAVMIRLPRAGTTGTAAAEPIDTSLSAIASDVHGLTAVDLDDAPGEELVLAVGPWRTYDLRAFRVRKDGGRELLGRLESGYINSLTAFERGDGERWLALAKGEDWPNRVLFPEPPHTGPPPGIYFARVADDGLEFAGFLPIGRPRETCDIASIDSGDLDGDGRSDLMAMVDMGGGRHALLILQQQADGSFAQRWLADGGRPRIVEVDGDPAAEIFLTTDDEVWLLGAGGDRLPLQEPDITPPRPPPPLLPADLDEPWRRADRLAAFGVPRIAAGALLDIARLVDRPDTRAAIEARASELYARAGELRSAINALEVASRTASFGDALRRRAALYRARLGDLREAAEAWRRAGGGPTTPGGDAIAPFHPSELAAVADEARRTTITFDQPLAPAWEIAGAGRLRRNPLTGRLEIDARDAPPAWASLPVEWDGGPIVISVDVDVERMGFNAQLGVGLRDGERWPFYGILETVGGAEIYNRVDNCNGVHSSARRDVPLHQLRQVRLTLAYSPINGERSCFFADERKINDEHRNAPTAPNGPLYLDIGALTNAHDQLTIVGGAIVKIELVGLRLAAPGRAPEGASEARRLLADGATEAAIEAFRGLAEPTPTDRAFLAIALAERQRFDEALAALAPLADLDDEALFGGIPPLANAELAPLLQPVLGDRYPAIALVASYIALVQHPHEPTTRELLLDGLPRLGAIGSDHPELLWIELIALQRRADLLDELGDPRAALADLDRLRALTEGRELSDPLRLSLVSAAITEAKIWAALGEVDAARSAVSEALARTPTPEVTLSRIAERPALLPFLEELGVGGGI